jgi:hypothetical protein
VEFGLCFGGFKAMSVLYFNIHIPAIDVRFAEITASFVFVKLYSLEEFLSLVSTFLFFIKRYVVFVCVLLGLYPYPVDIICVYE